MADPRLAPSSPASQAPTAGMCVSFPPAANTQTYSPFPDAATAVNRTTSLQAESTSNGVDRQGKPVAGSIHVYDGTNLQGTTRRFQVSYREEKGELVPELSEIKNEKPTKCPAQVLFYADGALYSATGERLGAFGLNNRAGKDLKDAAIIGTFGTLERVGGGLATYDPNTLKLGNEQTVIVNAPPPKTVRYFQPCRGTLVVDNASQTGHVAMELPGQHYHAIWTRTETGAPQPPTLTAETIQRAITEKQAVSAGESRWRLADGQIVEKREGGYAIIRKTVIPTDGVWNNRLSYGTGREDRELLNFASKPSAPPRAEVGKSTDGKANDVTKSPPVVSQETAPLPRTAPLEPLPTPKAVREEAPLPRLPQKAPLKVPPPTPEKAPPPRLATAEPKSAEPKPTPSPAPVVVPEMQVAERRHVVRLVQLAAAKLAAAEDDFYAARNNEAKSPLDVARTGGWNVSNGREMAATLQRNVVQELEQLQTEMSRRAFKPTEETQALQKLVETVKGVATKRIAELAHTRETALCREIAGAGREAAWAIDAYLKQDKKSESFEGNTFQAKTAMKITAAEVQELVSKNWLSLQPGQSVASGVEAIDRRAETIASCFAKTWPDYPEFCQSTLDKGLANFLGNRSQPLTIGETERVASYLRSTERFEEAVVTGAGLIQVSQKDLPHFRKIVDALAARAEKREFGNDGYEGPESASGYRSVLMKFEGTRYTTHRSLASSTASSSLTLTVQDYLKTTRPPIGLEAATILKLQAK